MWDIYRIFVFLDVQKALDLRNRIRWDAGVHQNVIDAEKAITKPAITSCGHVFCATCVLKAMREQGKCPTCRKPLHDGDVMVFSISGVPAPNAPALQALQTIVYVVT